jgi:hypothetical protein
MQTEYRHNDTISSYAVLRRTNQSSQSDSFLKNSPTVPKLSAGQEKNSSPRDISSAGFRYDEKTRPASDTGCFRSLHHNSVQQLWVHRTLQRTYSWTSANSRRSSPRSSDVSRLTWKTQRKLQQLPRLSKSLSLIAGEPSVRFAESVGR